MRAYTVSQINSYIRRVMDEDVFLSGVTVEAEISNFKEHSSGHLYFSLKDEGASINAVMFRGSAVGLSFRPANGMKVVVYGRVSAYEKTGACQVYAEVMRPSGTGGLYLAFIQLKEKLMSEGLFDASRKRILPKSPACVGIVTSQDGAAVRDIINVAARRDPGVRLLVSPASVQGLTAAAEIAEAINLLNAHGAAEVIIVGRGGGSMEDLWAFNEEAVARAVAGSHIPVISAVGHETDFTICDFAADLRAPTPSAAAEICVPDVRELKERAFRLAGYIEDAMEMKLADRADALLSACSRFPDAEELTSARMTRAGVSVRRISREIWHKLETAETRAGAAVTALHMAAPSNVLKRGFSILYIDGNMVKTAAEAEGTEGAEFTARLTDGMVRGKVTGITRGLNGGEKETDAGTGA